MRKSPVTSFYVVGFLSSGQLDQRHCVSGKSAGAPVGHTGPSSAIPFRVVRPDEGASDICNYVFNHGIQDTSPPLVFPAEKLNFLYISNSY
jgi:hypothetical protein